MAIPAQRQQNILNYLNDNYSITIQQAADLNHVSIATTRRDLDELGRAGLLRRTHGGAVLDDPDSISSEIIHNDKIKLMVSEKIRIAQKAAQMIADGSCIFLDSGTTTLFLAKQLKERKNLTLITNNLDIACNILLDVSSTLVVTGGTRRQDYNVLVHSLKSSAKTIGSEDLFERARFLELESAKEDLEYVRDNHGELMKKMHELVEKI